MCKLNSKYLKIFSLMYGINIDKLYLQDVIKILNINLDGISILFYYFNSLVTCIFIHI